MKKFLLVLMVVVLVVSVTACTGYETQTGTSQEEVSTEGEPTEDIFEEEPEEGISEEEIKEKIITVWDMNGESDMFAIFTDDGLLILYQKSKERAALYNYEVDGTTITAIGESSSVKDKVMEMSSIEFEDNTLSFVQNGGRTKVWYECDSETALEIIDIILSHID